MIPSTPVGVALLLLLIAPGLAYVLRREKVVPTSPRTAFREALQVVFASVASLAVIGLLATLLRTIAPEHTLDVRRLIQAPGPFARGHHVQVAWWSFGVLAAATLLAWVMADPRIIRGLHWLSTHKPFTWLTGASNSDIAEISGWWRVFDDRRPKDTAKVDVGVLKDDGTYIQGTLVSWTAGGLDYDKRELVLKEPLRYQTTDGKQHSLPVDMVVIAGRDIRRLDVKYLMEANTPDVGKPSGEA
ncbi:hypothetical protein Ade02nite_40480 [Paractinoplanes deccanensis]|uniref:Uncharacterized protein n=1 Tax=Paractinoplanes deccanensis TaxID=113561 RepID=A0ABQ3Y5Z4_9ACTN|nr:DUF6338 family protein [Actinoplanes deccanensis]GID75407.1 hypothetical protein Ade02nite_40480 [Actinoplanes deccanensis]